MRRILQSFAAMALAATHGSASAQPNPAPSANTPPEVVVEGKRLDENKRVCRTAVSTGSIMPTTICRTKAEWEEIRQRSIIAMEQAQQAQEWQRHTQALRNSVKE